ncbi:MAG: patatin-like phospholipase family protein, partial [Acidimicrobiales bacterium]
MKVGLVLGAGGTAGLAYHAGVLHALSEVTGLDSTAVDLIVGTSAGSVAGAYLRSGWTANDLWDETVGQAGALQPDMEILAPAFKSGLDLVRRTLGSAYVVGVSLAHMPSVPMPGLLRRAFPGGLFLMADGETHIAAQLHRGWPDRALWLCAADLVSGHRVVLGQDPDDPLSLRRAVMASCAIPAVYSPVRS